MYRSEAMTIFPWTNPTHIHTPDGRHNRLVHLGQLACPAHHGQGLNTFPVGVVWWYLRAWEGTTSLDHIISLLTCECDMLIYTYTYLGGWARLFRRLVRREGSQRCFWSSASQERHNFNTHENKHYYIDSCLVCWHFFRVLHNKEGKKLTSCPLLGMPGMQD